MVETDFTRTIMDHTWEYASLLSRVRKGTITANSNSMEIPGIDETSRADGSRWGGIRAYWADEAAQMTSSKPSLAKIRLTLNKLTGLCYFTDELLQDAAMLGDYVMNTFPKEFAFKIDDGIFRGEGSGKPYGMLEADCTIQVSKESNQTATTIVVDNLVKMYSRMWIPGLRNAIWVAHQDTMPQLMLLSLAVGVGGSAMFMMNVHAGPQMTIFARPLLLIEHASTLGTVGDIMFIDPTEYQFVDKAGIQGASSIHLRFDYNETAFRWTYRCDGQPLWLSAVTNYQGTDTVSPFIKLATRS